MADIFSDAGIGQAAAQSSNTQADIFADSGINDRPNVSSHIKTPLLDAVVKGFNRGVEDLTGGVIQALTPKNSTFAQKQKAYVAQKESEYSQAAQDHPIAAGASRLAGSVGAGTLVSAALPEVGVAKTAGVLAKTGASVANNAAQGAAYGASMYDDTGDSRLKNAATGAAVGGALGSLSAVPNTLKSLYKPARSIEDQQAVQSAADKYGVQTTLGDVGQNATAKKIENYSVGNGYRAAQLEQYQDAVPQFINDVAGTDIPADAPAVVNKMAALANKNKKTASDMFDEVGKMADAEHAQVNVSGLKQAAQEVLSKLPQSVETPINKSIKSILSDYVPSTDTLTYNDARALRSHLGSALKESSAPGKNETIAGVHKFLFKALDNDMENLSNASEDLQTKYRAANDYFKKSVVPFREPNIQKAIQGQITSKQFISRFIKDDAEQVGKLVNNLDDNTKTALKSAVLNQAMESATKDDVINPVTFANNLKKLGAAKGAVFGDQLKNVEGFAKLSESLRSAVNAKNSPNVLNGNKAAQLMLGAAGLGGAYEAVQNPVGTAEVVVPLITMAALFKSSAGKKLLTQAYNLPENADPQIWSVLTKRAANIAAIKATSNNNNNK